jgi:spore germination protein PE
MLRRSSFVQSIHVITIDSSSELQVGDSFTIDADTDVFAMVRDAELFFRNEADLKKFAIFNRPAVIPTIYEPLLVRTQNIGGKIQVNEVDITGIVASGIVHIGNNDNMYLESRRKHIRNLTIPPKK